MDDKIMNRIDGIITTRTLTHAMTDINYLIQEITAEGFSKEETKEYLKIMLRLD